MYIGGAIFYLHPARFASHEEPDHLQVDQRYLSKINDRLLCGSLHESGQFLDMLHTKAADESNHGGGTIGVFFYLQCCTLIKEKLRSRRAWAATSNSRDL